MGIPIRKLFIAYIMLISEITVRISVLRHNAR